MNVLNYYLRPGEDATLLLVAVENLPSAEGTYPCRVVGAISPVEPPAPVGDAQSRGAVLLRETGIPANLLGCAYLRTALTLLSQDVSLRRGLARGLYPRLAQIHATTPANVERAIRHAIAVAWARSGGEGYRRLLGRLASWVGERPTNAEFIAQAAEWLSLGDDAAPTAI